MNVIDDDSKTESERLVALRMQILEMHPFWGYMLMQMTLVPAIGLPTLAATDAIRHIWFNPLLSKNLTAAELGFVLVHEVCHQVFATTERRCAREPHKWNLATDYAINALVAKITTPGAPPYSSQRLYAMPVGALFNPRYNNLIAEVIYEDLCRQQLKSVPTMVQVTLPNSKGSAMSLPPMADHHGGIDLHLPAELDVNQRDILRERLNAAVENYYANDKQGHLPLVLLQELKILDRPKIPWRWRLHHYADTVLGADDYSLARPNKHYLEYDVIIPGSCSERVNNIVVALDTSGSMSAADLRAVAAEIRGLLPNVEDITLIVADASIQQVVGFEQLEQFLTNARFKGGGGTDHVCVFAYILQQRLNPSLFIGLSDLYSIFPRRKPPFPVLWIAPELHGDPPWGKVITV